MMQRETMLVGGPPENMAVDTDYTNDNIGYHTVVSLDDATIFTKLEYLHADATIHDWVDEGGWAGQTAPKGTVISLAGRPIRTARISAGRAAAYRYEKDR